MTHKTHLIINITTCAVKYRTNADFIFQIQSYFNPAATTLLRMKELLDLDSLSAGRDVEDNSTAEGMAFSIESRGTGTNSEISE